MYSLRSILNNINKSYFKRLCSTLKTAWKITELAIYCRTYNKEPFHDRNWCWVDRREPSSWFRTVNLDYPVSSSRCHNPSLSVADTMTSFVIFALMGLHILCFTLNEHTSECFRMSQSLTAPSCPQLKSSKGLFVKQTDITDCSWASKLCIILDLSKTLIMASSNAPTKMFPLEAILNIS